MDKCEIYDKEQLSEYAYFLRPSQAFAEFDDDEEESVIKGGIAYKDEFICGCCGSVYSFKDKWIKKLYVYKDWIDISDEIVGESADDLKIETE